MLGGHKAKANPRDKNYLGHAPDAGDVGFPMSESLSGVQALSAGAQDAQVTRWAAMDDEAKLGKALAGHNAEVQPRVKEVKTTRQVLAIQNVRLPQSAAFFPFASVQ